MTGNFVSSSHNTTVTASTDTDLKITGVIKDNMSINDDKWVDHWYGGLVPWWFAQAVFRKLGGTTSVKCKEPSSLRLDYDNDWLDEYGYHLTGQSSAPVDIPVLTSTLMYEKKVQRRALPYFTILNPDKDSHKMAVHWTARYYNYLNDLSKRGLRM